MPDRTSNCGVWKEHLEIGEIFSSTDIKKEGRMLYDSGNCKLARKCKLKPEEMKRIAQDYFDNWFESREDRELGGVGEMRI